MRRMMRRRRMMMMMMMVIIRDDDDARESCMSTLAPHALTLPLLVRVGLDGRLVAEHPLLLPDLEPQ
jgi:hypothetical protein